MIVDFVYTGNLDLTMDNVLHVLGLSDYLDVSEAVKLCCGFILSNVTIYNCMDFLNIREKYHLPDFRRKLLDFICRNFESIPEEKRISSLTVEDLESMLSQNDLIVSSEYNLFVFVINWISKGRTILQNYLRRFVCHFCPLMNWIR